MDKAIGAQLKRGTVASMIQPRPISQTFRVKESERTMEKGEKTKSGRCAFPEAELQLRKKTVGCECFI